MQQLTIGHYQVREELGRGLFGVTCKGVHVRDPGQQVALKIVHPVLAADPAFRAGLERASFALRSLIHPGVACFLTLGAGEQHLAVVRELVAGEPASALIARGPQPVEGTVRLLGQALAALAAIHAFGLAHGDLKPGDFFLCSDGRVRVTDPGLGVLARAALTGANGLPLAPLGHLAPEGLGAAGPRADLYALGLIAWELLVGHAACPSDEPVAMLGWHRYQGLTDPRHERADCPPWLASVLLQLAAMDPERRPGDAAQAFDLLRRTRAAAPVIVLATPPAPRRAPPGPPPAPTASRDEATLPHAFGAPEPARGVATLPHGLELPPGDGPGFGAAQPAPFGVPPPAEPPPAPSTSVPRGLGPAPAPVLRQDPEAKRREAVKIAVFWSITIGALVVSVVSFGGYRAIQAQRLAAARGLGSDVGPELFLGGYADRAQRDEAPREAEATPARAVTVAPTAVSERAPLAATPVAAPTGAGAFPVAEQGHMSLSSNPIGARIFLDNVEIGHTPLEGFAVAPGHHVVRIELDGYHWASRSIEAALGAAVDLGSIPMERVVADTGPVRLWSGGHSGACVFVDGRHVGHLPVETVLTRGTHTFFVQPTESEPFEVVLEVVTGVGERPADIQLVAP